MNPPSAPSGGGPGEPAPGSDRSARGPDLGPHVGSAPQPTGDEAPARRSRHAARELERYAGLFAARTRVMKSSAMRDLMAITERPEIISLAGGLPDTSTFPRESFAALMQGIAADSCARALQYGPTDGMAAVKDCIVEVMDAEGAVCSSDDVIVTTGGQQVIDLVTRTLIDPGDVIVAEAPTYPGAVPAFCSYEADVVQIEMDDAGMRIDELERTLDALERDGRRPKFIYTIPSFHNPAGVTLSLQRRQQLVQLARARELLVLEDNPYGLLRYEGEPLPTLYSLDSPRGHGGSDFVIYLGTFSKILAPGIRIGWAVAPGPVLDKLNLGKQAADLCSSSMSQLFVAAYFEHGHWRDYVGSLREVYRRRRDTMLDALAEHLGPEARWTHPEGGLFVWVTLPDYIDTEDLLARALEFENVAFVPGSAAYIDGRGASAMRLNFSGVGEDDIREGVRRIGKIVRERVDLYGTLTGARAPAAAEPRPTAQPPPAAPAGPDPALADVLQLPRGDRARRTGRARHGDER